MSSSLDAFLKEEKKNRKAIFVVLFSLNVLLLIKRKKSRKSNLVVLFSSKMLFSVEKKKNRKTIFVNFFFDRILSSFSLTSSLIIFESSIRLSSSFSSVVLRNLAVMFETLMNENLSSSKTHCDENFLSLIHDFVSSFVLSSDSFFFASLSLAQFVFLSFSDASRSHKRVRESLSSTLKKRVRSTDDHCDCKLSMK
jgi:hypothetical protein